MNSMSIADDLCSLDSDSGRSMSKTLIETLIQYNTHQCDLPIKAFHISTEVPNDTTSEKPRSTAVVVEPFLQDQKDGLYSNKYKHRVERKTWRVLLDSGSDDDILFIEKGSKAKRRIPYSTRKIPQNWRTSSGYFNTDRVANFELVFPEYSHSKRFKTTPDIVYLDESDPNPLYDLIIGKNTMEKMGVILDYQRTMITIDDMTLPMRNIHQVQSKNAQRRILADSYFAEPVSTDNATRRAVKILDADYAAAELPKVVDENCSHLSSTDKEKLLELLQEFEELFDGTLGDWKTSPAKLELKEDATPYHGRAFPVPRIHRDTLRIEVDRLVKLGVLKLEDDSEWASPTFILPKKQGTVRFLSDFREVN